MVVVVAILCVLGTVLVMEGLAWAMHKYLLHGVLWPLHRTHHHPNKQWWEANDLIAVLYAAASATGIIVGSRTHQQPIAWAGVGIAVYGVLYFLLHDVLIHRRIKLEYKPSNAYLKRLIRAHKLHHKNLQRQPGQAFGFLYAAAKYKEQ